MNIIMQKHNSPTRAVWTKYSNKADFSIVTYKTKYLNGDGRHIVAGDKKGYTMYNASPTLRYTGYDNIKYFYWKENQ